MEEEIEALNLRAMSKIMLQVLARREQVPEPGTCPLSPVPFILLGSGPLVIALSCLGIRLSAQLSSSGLQCVLLSSGFII